MYSLAVDTLLNKVIVVVDSPALFEQYLIDNDFSLPKDVLIEQGTTALTALSYGGEFIGNTGGSICTSGFVVTNPTGARGIVTAAHCSNNLNWQGNNGVLTYQNQLFPQDIQWHSLPANLANAAQNRILISESPNVFQTITSLAVPSAGIPVCIAGVISGNQCGLVVRTGFTTNYSDDQGISRQGFNMVQVSRNGQANGGGIAVEGDSGGPVYRGTTAVGLVHAGDGGLNIYITPINSVYALGLRLLTN